MVVQSLEKQRGVFDPSLPQSQIGESAQRRPPKVLPITQEVDRSQQLAFGIAPTTSGDEDSGVVRPAVARSRREVSSSHDVCRGIEPLLGSLNVVGSLARVEQTAEAAFKDRELVDLASADDRQCPVEVGHAVVDQSGEDEHHPQRRGRLALQIDVTNPASQIDYVGVLRSLHLEVRTSPCFFESSPSVGLLSGSLLDESAGPSHPSLGHSPVAEYPTPNPPHGSGGTCSSDQVTLAAIRLKRLLVGNQRRAVVAADMLATGLRLELSAGRAHPASLPSSVDLLPGVGDTPDAHGHDRRDGQEMNDVRTTEIADGIYQFTTHLDEIDFGLNQYLVLGEEPLLFHTGLRSLFTSISDAVAAVTPFARLRWIGFGHVEADECGSLNQWLAAAPNATAVTSATGCMVTVGDIADREPRPLADGDVLDIGGHRLRWIDTPHLPHGWEAGHLHDETTGTLFCGDLFSQWGRYPAVTDDDIAVPGVADDPSYSLAPSSPALTRQLAELQPRSLAQMHGPAYTGDGSAALHALADQFDARLTPQR